MAAQNQLLSLQVDENTLDRIGERTMISAI